MQLTNLYEERHVRACEERNCRLSQILCVLKCCGAVQPSQSADRLTKLANTTAVTTDSLATDRAAANRLDTVQRSKDPHEFAEPTAIPSLEITHPSTKGPIPDAVEVSTYHAIDDIAEQPVAGLNTQSLPASAAATKSVMPAAPPAAAPEDALSAEVTGPVQPTWVPVTQASDSSLDALRQAAAEQRQLQALASATAGAGPTTAVPSQGPLSLPPDSCTAIKLLASSLRSFLDGTLQQMLQQLSDPMVLAPSALAQIDSSLLGEWARQANSGAQLMTALKDIMLQAHGGAITRHVKAAQLVEAHEAAAGSATTSCTVGQRFPGGSSSAQSAVDLDQQGELEPAGPMEVDIAAADSCPESETGADMQQEKLEPKQGGNHAVKWKSTGKHVQHEDVLRQTVRADSADQATQQSGAELVSSHMVISAIHTLKLITSFRHETCAVQLQSMQPVYCAQHTDASRIHWEQDQTDRLSIFTHSIMDFFLPLNISGQGFVRLCSSLTRGLFLQPDWTQFPFVDAWLGVCLLHLDWPMFAIAAA